MKKPITIRLDEDVIVWFRSGGRGYQSRINDALRGYMDAIRPKEGVIIKHSLTDPFFKPSPKGKK
jgi:hypothetical protein